MADNVTLNLGAGGSVLATEDEGSVHYQKVKLTASGSGTTEALSKAEDTAHSSGEHGIMPLAVRNDALAALGGTDGDYAPLQVDADGALFTSGNLVEDVAHSSGDYGNMPLGVRNDTLAALGGTDGDYAPLQVDADGALYVSVASILAGSNLIGDVGIGVRTSGGTSIFRSIDLDEGTLEVVKASAGQIYWMHVMNLSTGVRFVKIYNATSGTYGTGTPVLTFAIPTQGDSNGAGFTLSVPNGIAFATGISIGAGTGVADNDTGAPGANDVVVNIGFA